MARKEQFLLLDSRAGILAINNNSDRLEKLDDDWDRYILVMGNAKWICNAANDKNYGDLCVVANLDGIIQWDWLVKDGDDSKWVAYGKKEQS